MLVQRHPEGLALTGIIRIDPEAPQSALRVRARQISSLLLRIHQSYYMAAPPEGLGLKYISPDPLPDPNDDQLTDWRIDKMQLERRSYFGAFMLDDEGQVPDHDDAMVGIAALERWSNYTELIEWDVDKSYRRKALGVGKALLQGALGSIEPDVRLVLDVISPNLTAIELYERYGFRFTGERKQYDMYEPDHLRYDATTGIVQQNVGGLAVCQEQLTLIAA